MCRKMFRLSGAVFFLLALVPGWVRAAGSVIELSAGLHRIEAEVAADPDLRAQGLMFRESMPPSHGMLFVFNRMATHCMWMRNTLLPLSVAFLDEEGRIINIADMKPQTETNHCAAKPARFALEMNVGWFARRGVSAGMLVSGIERAPQPR